MRQKHVKESPTQKCVVNVKSSQHDFESMYYSTKPWVMLEVIVGKGRKKTTLKWTNKID